MIAANPEMEIDLFTRRCQNAAGERMTFLDVDTFEGRPSEPMHLHKYMYSANNPIMYADPSGHDFSLTKILVGTGIGATLSGIDSYIAGKGPKAIFYDALIGGALGAITAPFATIKYARAAVLGIGTAFGALGAREAYLDGNSGLAIYRGAVTSVGLIAAGVSLAKLYAPGGFAQAGAALEAVGRRFGISPTRPGEATNPENVAALKAAMLDGTFEYAATRGRIGGFRVNGRYYVTGGHHRVTAAMEIVNETGNDTPLINLLNNGLWSEVSSPPVGSYSWGYGVQPNPAVLPPPTAGSVEQTLEGWDN